ncbi:MAG: hypothetical protein HC904_08050 [Blastochloris sp.]|nr:hypothetical protein [Blastochloris sp.]
MAIHVALRHQTSYHYDREVGLGPQTIRLRPAAHCRTPILSYTLQVNPPDHFINWLQDPHGNHLARLVFPQPSRRFEVTVEVVAEMSVYNPFDFFVEPSAEFFPFAYDKSLSRELLPYRAKRRAGKTPRSLSQEFSHQKNPQHRPPRRRQSTPSTGHPLPHPHGTRRANRRGNPAPEIRLLPRLRLAALPNSAPSRLGRPFRLRLPHPTQAGCPGSRRTLRRLSRLHRSPRLDRGLSARRRLDRPRPHLRSLGRRRPPPLGLHSRTLQRRRHQRCRR